LKRLDNQKLDKRLPEQLVEAVSWRNWSYKNSNLRIIDLGESFHRGAQPIKLAQPEDLRAPETVFQVDVDYRIDLWRAGLMVSLRRLNFQKRVLTPISADLHIHIRGTSIPVSWVRRRPGFTNDWSCGGSAIGLTATMGADA
jgi:hypothetical protein